MIKLRLEGTVEEIEGFTKWLKNMPRVSVSSESKGYKNRGKSTYSRRYLEVKLISVEEFMQGVEL